MNRTVPDESGIPEKVIQADEKANMARAIQLKAQLARNLRW